MLRKSFFFSYCFHLFIFKDLLTVQLLPYSFLQQRNTATSNETEQDGREQEGKFGGDSMLKNLNLMT